MYVGKWALLLAVFWLLLSGFLKPLLLIFGLISVVLVLFVLRRMDQIDNEQKSFDFSFKMLRYIVWLMRQVVSSSLEVVRLVWGSPKDLTPALAKVPVKDIPEDKLVLYANSITLTPGTLSVDLDENHVTVHALRSASINTPKSGGISCRIKKQWGAKTS